MVTLTNSQTEVQTRIDALDGSSTLTEVIEGGIAAKQAEAAGLTIDRTNLDIQITAQDTAVGAGTDNGELIAFLAANGSAGGGAGGGGATTLRAVYGNLAATDLVEPTIATVAPQGGYYRTQTALSINTANTLFTTTDTIIITDLRLAATVSTTNRVILYEATVGGVKVGSLRLNFPATGNGRDRTLYDVQQLIPIGVPLDGLTVTVKIDSSVGTSGTGYMDFIGGTY